MYFSKMIIPWIKMKYGREIQGVLGVGIKKNLWKSDFDKR